MTFLPIVERELRVAARKKTTYWTRFSAAMIAIVLSGWLLLVMRTAPPAIVARTLFTSLSILAFAYSLLAGVRNTADCVSEEKREDTLGLLFLTDLKGYDVAFGKLAANSLNSIYSLIAILPVLALPLLLGGVTIDLFLRVALLLADALFLSLTAGLLSSTVSRDARRATALTVVLILIITGGLPLAGALIAEYVFHRPNAEPDLIFLLPSPGYAFSLVLGAVNRIPTGQPHFFTSLAVISGVGWTFFALSVFILPRCWQDKPSSSGILRLRERWQGWAYGNAAERQSLRTYLLELTPFLWIAGRDRMKRVLVWGFLGLTALGWLWGYAEWRAEWTETPVGIGIALLMHLVIKVWVTSEACRHFMEQRRSGALELLLSTPLEVGEIIQGQLLALRRQFAGPVLATLGADVFLLGVGLQRDVGSSDQREMTLFFLTGMFMLVMDVFTLSWVGMWFGLSAKNLNRATSATISRILSLPWALFLGSMMLLVATEMGRTFSMPESSMLIGLAWWTILGVAVDISYMGWARRNLYGQFRLIAAQHYAPVQKASWLRIFRKRPSRSGPTPAGSLALENPTR